MTPDQRKHLRKVGLISSLAFIVIELYTLYYFLSFGDQPQTPGPVIHLGNYQASLPTLLIFPVFVAMSLLTALGDRQLWKAWAALFGGPALGALASLLSLSEGVAGMAIQTITIFLPIYSLVIFWKTPKNSLQT